MTLVQAVAAPDLSAILPGYDFADAYAGPVVSGFVSARALADRLMAGQPAWAGALFKARNLLARPFGLVHETPAGRAIGIFPLVSEAADQIVLGLDDRHLDFRIVLDLLPSDTGRPQARLATAVRTHNWGGRAYLRLVLPFHRKIVRAMLSRGLAARG